GIDVQLINVTDPNNQFLVEELSGFFFQDENLLIPSFLDRTGNEVGSFTNTFDFQNNSFLNEFEVTFDMELDVGETYALNIVSDVAASLNGEGAAFIDSSNSLNVSLSAVEPNTRLVVPAPSSLALLGIASLLCRRRR
ncbi:MAG: PEP-CTERM sorting domain-containing protein, partial [Planctomycetota bacterium]